MMTNFQFPIANIQLDLVVWVVIKWMAVIALLMYDVFAAVVIKQVDIMAGTIDDPANGTVKLFAWVHLAFALVVTVIMIVIL